MVANHCHFGVALNHGSEPVPLPLAILKSHHSFLKGQHLSSVLPASHAAPGCRDLVQCKVHVLLLVLAELRNHSVHMLLLAEPCELGCQNDSYCRKHYFQPEKHEDGDSDDYCEASAAAAENEKSVD